MTTTPAVSTPTPATSSSSTANNPLNQLSGNFNTFLTLLTTQLQNQDPTSPMDSNQFTQQLVQFSQVEQQINTNSNLQTLITQGQSAAGANAVGYLGKSVTVTNGEGALSGGKAAWTYALAAPSAATTLTVTNSAGQVVYSTAGSTAAGSHAFTWDGTDNNGNQLADGTYTLAATAQDASAASVTTAVSSSGVVSRVRNVLKFPESSCIAPVASAIGCGPFRCGYRAGRGRRGLG